MAQFDLAYKLISSNEGGFANVSGDKGGMTYCGIARNIFPNWIGWQIIDKRLPITHGAIFSDLNTAVKEFYRSEFWNKIKGDKFNRQELANQTFDFAVNAGVKSAILLLQEEFKLQRTGIMDDTTLKAINS